MKSQKEVKQLLKLASSKLIFSKRTVPNQGNLSEISGLVNSREAINIIDKLGMFKEVVQPLMGSFIFQHSPDTLSDINQSAEAVYNRLVHLRDLLKELIQIYELTVPDDDPNSINITLPDGVKDFDRLAKIANELKIAIAQPLIASDLNCETKIDNVQNGSIVFNITFECATAVVSIGAITFIKNLIGTVLDYRKKKLEGDLLVQQIEEKRLTNNKLKKEEFKPFVEELKEDNKEKLRELEEAEAQKLISEFFKEKTKEQSDKLNVLKAAIGALNDVFNHGVTFALPPGADEELKAAFPTVSEQQLLENKTKEIEEAKRLNQKRTEIEFLGHDNEKCKCVLGYIKCKWQKEGEDNILVDIEPPKFKVVNTETGMVEETDTLQYLHGPNNEKWTAKLLKSVSPDGSIEFKFKHTNWQGGGGQETPNTDYNDWNGNFRKVEIAPMKVTPTSNMAMTFSI